MKHSKNPKSYIQKLFIFGLIIQIPFFVAAIFGEEMFYNLFLSFTISASLIYLIDIVKEEELSILSWLGIFALIFLSFTLNLDYAFYGVLLVLMFYYLPSLFWIPVNVLLCYFYLDNIQGVVPYQQWSIIGIGLIYLYNGLRGYPLKYFFYFYYPIHLGVLYVIFFVGIYFNLW